MKQREQLWEYQGTSTPHRRNSKYKGPETKTSLLCFRNSKETREAGVKGDKGRGNEGGGR